MENASLVKTQRILNIMQVLTWIVFIALMVQAGAIVFVCAFSLFKPEVASKLYTGENMLDLLQADFTQYTIAMFFKALLPGLKAYIAYVVIKTLTDVNLQNPFTMQTVHRLESISYDIVAIWVVGIIQHIHGELIHRNVGTDWGGGEALFIAALVYVIAQVFKRGIELQSESDLTV